VAFFGEPALAQQRRTTVKTHRTPAGLVIAASMLATGLGPEAKGATGPSGVAIAFAGEPGVSPPDGGEPRAPTVEAAPDAAAQDAPERVGRARARPFVLPTVDDPVDTLLAQDYLSDEERRSLRLRHGLWEATDLSDVPSQAMAALTLRRFDDSSLADASAPALDRAEARLAIGDADEALALLAGDQSARAQRLRAQALLDLGRAKEAEEAIVALVGTAPAPGASADDVGERVRAAILLARLRGAEGPETIGYQEMLDALGDARDRLDRLSWRVPLAEALLLYEKDDYAQASQALERVLTLNPRCAEGWTLLGMIAADTFDFPRAERHAATLEMLASGAFEEADDLHDVDDADDGAGARGPESPAPGASLDAQVVRAMVRLRQNEGAEALEQLGPLLARAPRHREGLALRAAAMGVAFDLDGARAALAEFDAHAPGSPHAAMRAGKALASARQYEDAAEFLRLASERAPRWAEPVVELGLSELQAGRLPEARAALTTAISLDRFHKRAANSLKLLDEIDTYVTVESDHFVVRYKPGPDEVLAREMLPTLERIFVRVTGDRAGGIRHAPPRKTVVELYPNHRWFSTRITGLPALHTFAAATGPVIAMEAPREGPGHLVGPYDWARVVQHEYTHTVTLSRTKNRLPHWFTEASAVYLEDAPKDYSTVRLLASAVEADGLFDFDTINVMFVRPRRPSDRGQAYAQGAWMYEHLIERYGEDAPLSLMDLYAQGVREPEAFERVLGVSRERFFAGFLEWARGELESWGMRATERHKDLAEVVPTEEASQPSPETLERLRSEHPGNPFVLEALVRLRTPTEGATVSPGDLLLLREYAAARPVDPLPHKLIAAYALAHDDGLVPEEELLASLEYLDAREQHATSFAAELARRYAARGDWDRSLAKSRRATQIAPYDGRLRELAATLAIQAKRLDVAEEHIWALTMIEPDRPIHQQRLEAIKAKRK
jgi:tetratricopeptide (TPR) repeat protein